MVRNGDIFWGSQNYKKILGVFEIPDILGLTVDAGPEPTYEEKLRVPPPPPPLGMGSLIHYVCTS